MTKWKPSLENCCLERSVDFVVPIKISLGPKSTRVTQKQRCRFVNENEINKGNNEYTKEQIFESERKSGFLPNVSMLSCIAIMFATVLFNRRKPN